MFDEVDLKFMRLALAEAQAASTHEDVPVGCVVVRSGELIGSGRNRREQLGDPTAHAEIEALRAAARVVGHWRLEQTTVYVTLEPCVMCAGAMVQARVERLVYAATDFKAGAISSLYDLSQDARLNHRFSAQGGLLAGESVELLQAFFQKLRASGQK